MSNQENEPEISDGMESLLVNSRSTSEPFSIIASELIEVKAMLMALIELQKSALFATGVSETELESNVQNLIEGYRSRYFERPHESGERSVRPVKEDNMSEKNRQLLHRWFEEVWNKGQAEAIDELFATDGIAHGLADETGAPLKGPAGFKPFYQKFRGAFPDIVVTIEDTVAEGDKVAARCSVRAKHTGDHLGFEATQKPMEITGMAIVRIKDGKIVEAWNNFDFMSMFKQLGAL